jgi:hypothetical protein
MWPSEIKAGALESPRYRSEEFDFDVADEDDFTGPASDETDVGGTEGYSTTPKTEKDAINNADIPIEYPRMFVMRHLQSKANANKRLGGQLRFRDPDLSTCDYGDQDKLRNLKGMLSEKTMVVCSPLRRTWETLHALVQTEEQLPKTKFWIEPAFQEHGRLGGYDKSNECLPPDEALENMRKWVTECNHKECVTPVNSPECRKDPFDTTVALQRMTDLWKCALQNECNLLVIGHSQLFQSVLGVKLGNGESIELELVQDQLRAKQDVALSALSELPTEGSQASKPHFFPQATRLDRNRHTRQCERSSGSEVFTCKIWKLPVNRQHAHVRKLKERTLRIFDDGRLQWGENGACYGSFQVGSVETGSFGEDFPTVPPEKDATLKPENFDIYEAANIDFVLSMVCLADWTVNCDAIDWRNHQLFLVFLRAIEVKKKKNIHREYTDGVRGEIRGALDVCVEMYKILVQCTRFREESNTITSFENPKIIQRFMEKMELNDDEECNRILRGTLDRPAEQLSVSTEQTSPEMDTMLESVLRDDSGEHHTDIDKTILRDMCSSPLLEYKCFDSALHDIARNKYEKTYMQGMVKRFAVINSVADGGVRDELRSTLDWWYKEWQEIVRRAVPLMHGNKKEYSTDGLKWYRVQSKEANGMQPVQLIFIMTNRLEQDMFNESIHGYTTQ